MLKDITLGQYFPGESVVHRLDPRTKLLFLIIYIVALFTASSWISYGVVFLFLATAIAISHIPLKSIVRGMKPLLMILQREMMTDEQRLYEKDRIESLQLHVLLLL